MFFYNCLWIIVNLYLLNYRGIGLVVGVDIVTDKESKKPAKEAAELLTYKYLNNSFIFYI